ncbi:MAG: DUF115 domain-containing protein [Treponema sp.]|nr:DUF115 domain-containing protein [Treponema sp.]
MIKYSFLTAKNGSIVPALLQPCGNTKPLHSTIDPVREAQKLLATIPEDTGFIVFLGLGGGFAPLAALDSGARVAVIDFDKSAVNQLLASKDYSQLVNNQNFTLLTDPANGEIQNFILNNYKPAIHGGIRIFPLRTRTDQDKELFEAAAAEIQKAIENTGGDYSVQAYFGKRWFCNIIRNIANFPNNEAYNFFSKYIKDAAIVAAGPSLDTQIEELAKHKTRGTFIICSDTAIGVLLHNGIKPDAVVSIDCQHISYFHFLGYNISGIPLILDIASPPMLGLFSSAPLWVASGHPLARYLCAKWAALPCLDTSGGNVTYACLSLAENLGAQNITLFGADFAYAQNRTYAKGTYVYPYFEKKQNRFASLEAQLSAFLYRNPFLPAEPGQKYKETAQLKFYRNKLEEKTGITIMPGQGKPVQILLSANKKVQETQNLIKQGCSPIEFLNNYRKDITAAETNSEVFTTLLPYAAFIKHRNPGLKGKDLIEETKQCCIEEIDRVI